MTEDDGGDRWERKRACVGDMAGDMVGRAEALGDGDREEERSLSKPFTFANHTTLHQVFGPAAQG